MKLLFYLELAVAYLLYWSGLYWIRRKLLERRGASVVLVYHRIVPGRGRAGSTVGEASLERQLRFLRESCIPSDWDGIRPRAGAGKGIRVLVTFDDAYREIFTTGIPLLEKYRVPAIVFVPTDFTFRRRPIETCGAPGPAGDPFPAAEDLERAASSPLVALGNHTASHPIVSSLPLEAFAGELARSQVELGERLGGRPVYFAFPRGRKRDIPAGAGEILAREGIEAAFTMMPGLVGRSTDPYLVPRIGTSHVNDMILFKVKMLGMLATLVRLRDMLNPA